MPNDRFQLVFMTAANADEARRIAKALVEERLAACVNIVEPCRSVYRWNGEIVEDKEAMLFAKTGRGRFDSIVKRVRELHSYEVPEIIAVDLESLSDGYAAFLKDALGG
ncbi:MAG: divalent-cation tolerance protein CutA [Candidatus Krumholzibacteriota bacterium]|nr:divalent-cation tolerance protein CutA [Candidatus Krumholzibacteriota bacterium]